MNYDDKKHVIEYIEGSKIKKFEVPKKDYNLKFDKMSYNDVLMYIRLTKEEQANKNKNNTIKYKSLKTVAAKTKDYFAQDIKLMSQAERLKKIAEYLISGNIQELKEFLSSDVFYNDPIIKSIMTLLNNKGYTIDEIKNLIKQKDNIDLYTNEIENCIVKDGVQSYSFEDITFKNTLGDLFDLTKQVNILQEYTSFVPIDNTLNFKFISDTKTAFKQLYSIFFKGLKFSTSEGKKASVFMSNDYVTPSVYTNNYNDYLLHSMEDFQLNNSKIPYYFYCTENQKIYINIKILYYLLQFNPTFKKNNYKFVVEKLKNDVVENVILIAGSAFDLDNIINSLNETTDTKDYYEEYVNLMSDTIKRFFNKEFTQVVHKKKIKPKIDEENYFFEGDRKELIEDPILDSDGLRPSNYPMNFDEPSDEYIEEDDINSALEDILKIIKNIKIYLLDEDKIYINKIIDDDTMKKIDKIKSMTKILNNYDGIDEIINKANEELKKEQKETIDTFDDKNYIEKMDKVIDKIKKLNIVPNSITKNINNVLAQKGKTSDKRKYLILKYYYKVFKQISQNIETNDLKDAYKHMNDNFSDSEGDTSEEREKEYNKIIEQENKKGKGIFSFRRDTKETLQSLLNRIIKLESTIETQNEQIKQLKTGIKSINQSLSDDKRKEVFGNYFSNSIRDYEINGALNPDKVYPKITFSEFRKLYNKLDSKGIMANGL